jgi:GAF domain-containing protein
VNEGSRSDPAQFAAAYASALQDYLGEPGERALTVAYELGREAVRRHLSVLDLAVAYQEALAAALARTVGDSDPPRIAQAAGDFFLESLSSFEMVQRGGTEAREAIATQRRQTELSRQLSTFLSDASLARGASDTLQEMLALVAEQGRELVAAECCVATVGVGDIPRLVQAASHPEGSSRWPEFTRDIDLSTINWLVRQSGGSVRLAGRQLKSMPWFHVDAGDPPLRCWLAASLTGLDGQQLGLVQAFDGPRAGFGADDQATLVHLAQTAAAAVERVRLYDQRSAS